MKPAEIEAGCIYLGLTGPAREVVTKSGHNLEYRVVGEERMHGVGAKHFASWAMVDVTERMGKRWPEKATRWPQEVRKDGAA